MSKRTVIVVGGGNAALCAALSAREQGAEVVVLERAPEALAGGNSAFTAGAMRVAYTGVEDIRQLVPDLSEADVSVTDFGAYTKAEFLEDIGRVTDYRCDPELASILTDGGFETLCWMRDKGVRFVPIYGRQAFQIDGRFKFWGGLVLEASGGGPGLISSLLLAAKREGIDVRFSSRATNLIVESGRVSGVVVRTQDKQVVNMFADAVVLACGGFQANVEMRTKYLGPSWDLVKVRGTRFNTGDGHRMALEADASPAGTWSGAHAVAWEMNAPEFGGVAVGDGFQKHSYPWSVMVNANGERFVDEGADFRNYTYAKYGRRVLEQPGNFAWQVFDQKETTLLRDEYRIRQVTKVTANSLGELADKMIGVDPKGFLREIAEYNAAVDAETPFDPNVKDGRGTHGLPIAKSNWANRIDEPPFEAYGVTCGITFTFGGLRINTDAQVIDSDMNVIEGLYAAGEIVGGIFYLNYPGGSGLTNGAVFGRIAGGHAGSST